MKSITRFAKRALSLVLCLTMVMTTMLFFDIGITKSEAAVSVNNPTASDELPDVLFYVPEAIYLRPRSDSWIGGSTSTFHFFIENTVTDGSANLKTAPSVNTSTPTTGNVYFQYANAKDGTVQLSYRWLNSSLSSPLDGNGIRLGSADVGVNKNLVLSKVSNTNYYKTTISAANSKSPHLGASDTGCYIEWTAKYHDNADNLDKSITAYTYVYKPYVVPLVGGFRVVNDRGDDHYNSQITWLTGFHYMHTATTAQGDDIQAKYSRYATSNKAWGLLPFITNDAQAINDNTANAVGSTLGRDMSSLTEKSANASRKTLYFASTNTEYAYFYAGQENSTFNNANSNSWLLDNQNASATPANNTTFNVAQHSYSSQDDDAGSKNDRGRLCAYESNGFGGMYIDTSRYTNLAQVPNLGVGLMQTDSKDSDAGAWYVADYTDRTNSYSVCSTSNGTNYTTDMWNCWNDRTSIIARYGALDNRIGDGKNCEVKYAGTWDKEISSPTGNYSDVTYKVKSAQYTKETGDPHSILTCIILGMKVKQYNKANLRTAVANAQKEFAHLGIYSVMDTSDPPKPENNKTYESHYYYNDGDEKSDGTIMSSSKFTAFINAYKTACEFLTAVDKPLSSDPNTLANNLNNALSALKSDTASRKTGKATQYNVGVIYSANGDYRTVTIPNSAAIIKEDYYLRDKIEFTAETYTGYSFLGKYKLSEALDANGEKQLFSELYDVASPVPEATHGGNRQNVSLSHDTDSKKAAFTQLSTVSTSTAVATFADDNTTVTYPYTYDTDVTYVYFYVLNTAEVLFDNEFDFDEYRWTGFSDGTMDVDRVNNVLTINSGSGTDVYTNNYNSLADQRAYMTLVPGRRYELSYDFKNESSSAVRLRPMVFFFNSETATSYGSNLTEPAGNDVLTVPAGSTMTDSFVFKVPDGNPYTTIRLGFLTANVKCQISKIAVRDISVFTPTEQTNTVTLPDPLHLEGARGTTFTSDSFPTTSRPGYVFGGWSEVRAANGNGDSAHIVSNVTVPHDKGNKKLYAVWQTNITYDLNGGTYRRMSDPTDPAGGRLEVKDRSNIDVNQNIAVSNRLDKLANDDSWNSTDINNAFVPYRVGFNFKGWKVKDSSIEPTMRGKVYWPGQTVNTCSNVEFEAVWEPAYTTDADTYLRIGSSHNNNDRAFYPGQVHFFKYTTPDRNQYVSAYTYSSTGNLVMQMFKGETFEVENDNRENSYGIRGMSETDPMIVASLSENTEYIFGISQYYIADTVVDGTNFEITEHTVNYQLQPNGGEIVDLSGDGTTYTNSTQTVIGYDNEPTELPSNGKNYGYEISGWQTASGETKTYNVGTPVSADENHSLIANNTSTLVTVVPLNAMWSPKPFSVTYDLNKGNSSTTPTMTSSSSTLWFKTPGTLTTDEPTMPGYTFKGWAETPNKVENETLYKKDTATGLNIGEAKSESFFRTNDGAGITLYARWAPNLILVHFKPSEYSTEEEIRDFRFDEQKTLDPMQFNEAEQYTVEFYNEGVKIDSLTQMADLVLAGWTNSTGEYKYYLNDDKTLTLLNPNGETGNSDTVGTDTYLYAFWKNAEGNDITDATTITSPVWERTGYVLAGWADPNDTDSPDTTTVDYVAGSKFVPQSDMQLHAVWHPTASAETNEGLFDNFGKTQSVIQGVIFKDANDLSQVEHIEALSVPQYSPEKMNAYKAVVERYQAAKAAFEANKSAENNNELYASIKELESFKLPTDADATAAVDAYLSNFKIEYAPGVEGKVPAGTYSLANMNLNHYTEGLLEVTKGIYDNALTVKSIFDQETINKAVIALAQAYANKQDVKESTPVYNVYDTVDAIKSSGLTSSTDISAMSYVYTGKGNNTYYCYTNSEMPVMYVTVDEDLVANDRVCYPTSAGFGGDIVMTAGANTIAPTFKQVEIDDAQKSRYLKYTSEGIGLKPIISDGMGGTTVGDADYYNKKTVIELRPDFSNVNPDAISSTVKYTFKAYDDAFALTENDINYADAAALASGAEKGKLNDIPQGEYATNKSDGEVVTPENTITILIDYHVSATDGVALDVNGKQVYGDEWLKQYHLTRTSGGAGNWEMVKRDDAIYTIDDPTYGQTNFGSFTYTFRVGGANDFANCVLTSSDVKDVVSIVKENYDAIRSVPFTSAKATTRFAHEKDAQGNDILDSNGNPKVYVETVPAGTGLGFKEWPQTTWSYNYYPASQVYTYVHVVDRWGNVVDKVIETPNVDANAVQFLSQSVGDVTAAELGGSGIDTMSFSAQSFDIIPDDNSTFDGTTYTTTGNTVKLYTGEANKTYNLTANDVATNTSKGTATTDADGYLTITVEDLAFDTQSGAYTFTLNDKTINLYAEVEDVILSAEDVTVGVGETATVSITTTDAATMVQLVSASGATATATEYTEDEDGNRVWHIDVKKNPGSYAYEVKAKVDGKWITEGESVTVTVNEPTIFVGAVTAVEYTPSTSTRNEFMFTVTGRPDKIQVIEPDGGTRTYDRYHAKVVIVSYDAEGNVIGSMSRELSYEVWTIEMNVPADIELTAIARYGRAWSTAAPYTYTVVLATPEFDDEVYSMELASTEGKQGKVQATVITGLDVSGVRFVMDNDTTTTYYTPTEADGKLTYVGNAWMNHSGENIIIVKIRVNNAWLNAGELTYLAI